MNIPEKEAPAHRWIILIRALLLLARKNLITEIWQGHTSLAGSASATPPVLRGKPDGPRFWGS
jgi:hypothetical protein